MCYFYADSKSDFFTNSYYESFGGIEYAGKLSSLFEIINFGRYSTLSKAQKLFYGFVCGIIDVHDGVRLV